MNFSITTIFTVLFIVFILNSVYNLVSLFMIPSCSDGDVCYDSYLNSQPSLDLLIFLSDSSKYEKQDLIEEVKNFAYTRPWEKEVNLTISQTVRNNGSLFIQVLLVPSNQFRPGMSLREAANLPNISYLKRRLTRHAVPVSASFNLLNDDAAKQHTQPVTHLKSKFGLVMCSDTASIPHAKIPPEILRYMRLNNKRQFMPVWDEDILETRLRDLVEITADSKTMTFNFIYKPTSFGKFRFLCQIEQILKQFMNLGFTHKDLDEVKGVFADTNLYLLVATIFISSIHLLFDFLAFKNDISFWRKQKSTAGLSTRAILWRAFSQTIVFLYLLNEGTSLLVLVPSGICVLIEFWKVTKILKAKIIWTQFRFERDVTQSKEEIETMQHDEECMRYLSLILYPLCVASAIYSLVYYSYTSWYSWVINSLANGVYTFGFLFMLPQLFVNYRLKSVAALPWRAFAYRAFNTFIDDIFAFIITMPTAHRMACFRDDIIFFIYLYQRRLYPVDKTRTDEITPEVSSNTTEKKKL